MLKITQGAGHCERTVRGCFYFDYKGYTITVSTFINLQGVINIWKDYGKEFAFPNEKSGWKTVEDAINDIDELIGDKILYDK